MWHLWRATIAQQHVLQSTQSAYGKFLLDKASKLLRPSPWSKGDRLGDREFINVWNFWQLWQEMPLMLRDGTMDDRSSVVTCTRLLSYICQLSWPCTSLSISATVWFTTSAESLTLNRLSKERLPQRSFAAQSASLAQTGARTVLYIPETRADYWLHRLIRIWWLLRKQITESIGFLSRRNLAIYYTHSRTNIIVGALTSPGVPGNLTTLVEIKEGGISKTKGHVCTCTSSQLLLANLASSSKD